MTQPLCSIPFVAPGESQAPCEDSSSTMVAPAVAEPCCGAAMEADQPAASAATSASDTAEEVQLPTLLPLLEACQSDNEAEEEGHLRKARRVSFSEPPPSQAEVRHLPGGGVSGHGRRLSHRCCPCRCCPCCTRLC